MPIPRPSPEELKNVLAEERVAHPSQSRPLVGSGWGWGVVAIVVVAVILVAAFVLL